MRTNLVHWSIYDFFIVFQLNATHAILIEDCIDGEALSFMETLEPTTFSKIASSAPTYSTLEEFGFLEHQQAVCQILLDKAVLSVASSSIHLTSQEFKAVPLTTKCKDDNASCGSLGI